MNNDETMPDEPIGGRGSRDSRTGAGDDRPVAIAIKGLTMAFGDFILMRDLNFEIRKGDVFVIMGGSGCGKSTLLMHMLGFLEPHTGSVWYGNTNFTEAEEEVRVGIIDRTGVSFQSGALWSHMTLEENISLLLEEKTDLTSGEIKDIASFKLALVGLRGFEDYYPSEISGGMNKRAALARAMALDPDVLFFDEPGAGLDPLSARRSDDLILELSESLGTTIVLVTHELDSIFSVANNSVFLDVTTRTQADVGDPLRLRDHSSSAMVRNFLRRGEAEHPVEDS
jgi:phospholipid/cholesterol/gamma-HCH transport system ATP-binding protein